MSPPRPRRWSAGKPAKRAPPRPKIKLASQSYARKSRRAAARWSARPAA